MEKRGVRVIMVNGQVATFVGRDMSWYFTKPEEYGVDEVAALFITTESEGDILGSFDSEYVAGVYHIQ